MAKSKKELNKAIRDNKVTMTHFLNMIIGTKHPIIYGNRLTHQDVKELFPELERTSFDYVYANPEVLYNGKAYLVEDCHHKIIPYLNPLLNLEDEVTLDCNLIIDYDANELNSKDHQVKEIPDIHDIDLTSLSLYELYLLLQRYKDANIKSAMRKVHDEIVSRSNSKRASAVSKYKIYEKERKTNRRNLDE